MLRKLIRSYGNAVLTSSFAYKHGDNCKHALPFSPGISDHRFAISGEVATFNGMKQGNGNNNGFGTTETHDQYLERFQNQTYAPIADILENNGNVAILACQEMPIDKHGPIQSEVMEKNFPHNWKPSSDGIFSHYSNYGVTTHINYKRLNYTKPVQICELTQDTNIKGIEERFVTFAMTDKNNGQPKYVTNLHLNHGSPAQEMRLLGEKVIRHLCNNHKDTPRQHLLVGDWNLTPNEIDAIMKNVYDSIKSDLESNPVKINITYHSSVNGHKKRNGELKSVDGKMVIEVRKSKDYEYSFNYRRPGLFAAGVMGLMFSPIPAFNDEIDDEIHKITARYNNH